MSNYSSGLDRLLSQEMDRVRGKYVGLITNHTGTTRELRSNVDVLHDRDDVAVAALFGPEHGVRGSIQAGGEVVDHVDPKTGIPIYSLYGDTRKPTPDMLSKIDLLVFDIQDVGVRYYTYVSTMFYAIEACGENNVPFLVLDRYNPIGRRVEGNILEEGFESFVGALPMPQRHGMTVGELALWANTEFNYDAEVEVVKCQGWNGQYADAMDIPWVPPSPNIPSAVTSLVYPITCLFEGTNLSEGRGTANPFEYIGAPWIDPLDLAAAMRQKDLSGVLFRPVYFQPTFSKHVGEECGGVQVAVTDKGRVDSCLTGLTLLKTIFELYPQETNWRKPPEGAEIYAIDRLMGTDAVRNGLDRGKSAEEITADWKHDAQKFKEARTPYLLY